MVTEPGGAAAVARQATPVSEGGTDWFPVLRAGDLAVRLASSPADVIAVQELRYRIFYEELDARPNAEMVRLKRDFDAFDDVCDHLLVIDDSVSGNGAVVGNYRLLRGSVAHSYGSFYTAGEYDIEKLEAYPGEKLELGRSCVAEGHRNRPTMQLLWRGIAHYIFHWNVTLMFGCGSLPGTDITRLANQLSYLYHYHLAPPAIRPRALPFLHVPMETLPLEHIDPKVELPPLIKGYLRLGGFVGDGAVVDRQFNTTDVCIVVPTELITERYLKHYERAAGRNGNI